MKEALPRGFDTRLLALNEDGTRRKYTHFQVKWFKDHFDELMLEVKARLDLTFAPSMDAKFATKAYLHRWLVTKMIESVAEGTQRRGRRGGS